AHSYYSQGRFELIKALQDARAAVARSPRFGFGWERVAELEFSFGRVSRASEALARSLELAPRNAQAYALNGFILSSQNRVGDALAEFDAAIAIDGSLGNAWLGRGLCLVRRSHAERGRH